jgi:septum formation protein
VTPPGDRPTLVLASGSPRRLELLRTLGLDPLVLVPDVDEAVRPGEAGPAYVARLAVAKAAAVQAPGRLTVAADTTVDLDGELLGKPGDADEARRLLRSLSGRSHRVHTGVAVSWFAGEGSGAGTEVVHEVSTTVVTFGEVPHRWVEWYVATSEPYDKAGGYGIQGAAGVFVSHIDGSPSNVVGLPLDVVARLVARSGHDLVSFAG